jgi:hypothetical protein
MADDPYGSPFEPYGQPAIWWIDHPNLIGVTQRTELAEDSAINLAYRSTNLMEWPHFTYRHLFGLHAVDGPTGGWTARPDHFFTTGSYGGNAFTSPLHVTSYLSLPNGNSFVGTDYRFTAAEFTLDELSYGSFSRIVSFTAKFYGVPEPGTLTLVLLCAAMVPLVTGRTTRSR